MITFPCAKINLGLNIVNKRSDGYHELQTVFYPTKLTDTLEIKRMDDEFPVGTACDLKIYGIPVACNEQDNLVVKAYNLIAQDYDLPRIHAHLFKQLQPFVGRLFICHDDINV
ncbi:MAG: 4-(cytidine 5'-diphospho)-2-C-methyl-D-erythritol kinase, partial [Prevotella sp.]|nr:4-(cytidine 5'-diphospho)-2-C-methyl-D-erythritol kinase [Prevotella sp.]